MDYSSLVIHNLPPQSTVFVGRRSEIKDIVSRFQDDNCRLLTLVGSGGIGKTRLAIESIPYLIESDFEHGAFYVPLAPLVSPDNIITTIINVLGIHIGDNGTSQDELVNFLSQRNLLLILDNFEHLLDGTDIIADILHSAPHVKILITSRENLNLSMEHVWQVRGMRYPDSNEPDAINQYDAVNLFVERALQVQHDFSLGDQQIAIIKICQLVDGLPLAIELAAGWLKTLSCQDIIHQIERGIDFLATRNRDIPDRHRSIRAVFDHSWDLLSDEEQVVFPRLAIFRGGFTLDAAEHIAKADLLTLSGLVEKSMVRRDHTGRYDIHELLRQYGEERLYSLGDFDTVNERQLDYFAKFMEQRIPDLQGRRQIDSFNEIRADFDNIYIAFQYACEHSNYVKLDQMLECLAIYFEIATYPRRANEMYALASSQLDKSPKQEHQRIRNRINVFANYTLLRQRNSRHSLPLIDDTLSYLKHAEKYDDQLATLMCLIIIMVNPQNPDIETDMQRTLKFSENIDSYYTNWTLEQICNHYLMARNKYDEATHQYMQRYLSVAQAINDTNSIATAYYLLAQRERFWGSIDDAIFYFDKAALSFQQTQNKRNIAVNKALAIFMKLKQGMFEYVVQETPYWAEQLARFGFFTNHPYINMVMGKGEALLANYARSASYIQIARTYQAYIDTRLEFHIIEVQIMCAIGDHDFKSVRHFIIEALKLDTSVISTRLIIDFVTLVVFLYHHDRQFIKAVELLGLIFTHPLATTGWMEKWELLSQLHDTLQQELGQHAYTIAWEQGTLRDVEETITEIRAYVGLESLPNQAPQPLVEPLTDRELDVLELLGKGYSNRDIARELIVSIGTVKSHVYNICQKLNVNNRTQAVLEAKQLGLL